jgi:hypothetical protein
MEQITLSERALVKRINRVLKRKGSLGWQLKKARGGKVKSSVGDYYILDIERNFIMQPNVDIEEYAREIGVLQDHERFAE